MYLLLCIFAQLFNSRLERSYSESFAVSSFHLKTSPRSHFIYCIVESSCSQEYFDQKNDNAANSNLVINWNNLAVSSTHLKLGFYRFYDVLSLEYAPKFRSFNSIHLSTRSLVEIFPKCNCLVSEFWKWLSMAWNSPIKR